MALVLTGNLALGVDSSSEADVGDEVTSFKVSASVETVTVPATMGTPEHGRGGAADYSITIGYLSNDLAASLFSLLWDALVSETKTLFFSGSLRDDTVSASNPRWSGTFVVSEVSIGAAAEALSTGSATFPLTGAPTLETT